MKLVGDLPTFTASNYATSNMRDGFDVRDRRIADPFAQANYVQAFKEHEARKQEPTSMAAKAELRIVRVFLVDPDERVPIDKRVLYRSEEIITDNTDQELFFGIPVNDLLKDHNAFRATVEWEEKTSEGTKTKTGLKEVRIRDLFMSVTTIAKFESRSAA